MQDESKIQALLQSATPENQKIAVQLIQSQWNWTLEKAFDYVIKFYCKGNFRTVSLFVGDVSLAYFLDHHVESERRLDEFLMFELKENQIVKKQEKLTITNISYTQETSIGDYLKNIQYHFKNLLPTLYP